MQSLRLCGTQWGCAAGASSRQCAQPQLAHSSTRVPGMAVSKHNPQGRWEWQRGPCTHDTRAPSGAACQPMPTPHNPHAAPATLSTPRARTRTPGGAPHIHTASHRARTDTGSATTALHHCMHTCAWHTARRHASGRHLRPRPPHARLRSHAPQPPRPRALSPAAASDTLVPRSLPPLLVPGPAAAPNGPRSARSAHRPACAGCTRRAAVHSSRAAWGLGVRVSSTTRCQSCGQGQRGRVSARLLFQNIASLQVCTGRAGSAAVEDRVGEYGGGKGWEVRVRDTTGIGWGGKGCGGHMS